MGKRHGGFSVLCLLCASVLASVAADSAWHPNPARPGGIGSKKAGSSPLHGIPARHHALPPLSAPPPTAGADLPPPSRAPEQPHFGFPLQPTFGFTAAPPVGPSGGEGYPFIGSNPTVPLPTGMTDTASVLPLPDTGAGTDAKAVGYAASVRVHITMIGLAVIFSTLFLS
ncbi:hypothetical protein EJB05_18933 [Eragrostis curvula]|uniref:Uncharacterized protein n=1 Tax=Eragrostis curvula TaxID=38414 RepID=A0A5J9VMZ9_9POAL|nr:hypothetical protein EJB05_18933 [Eragrostis curvula]